MAGGVPVDRCSPEVVEIIDYHWLVRPNTAIE